MGNAFLAKAHYNNAMVSFRKALELSYDDSLGFHYMERAKSHMSIGMALRCMGDVEAGLQECLTALDIHTSVPDHHSLSNYREKALCYTTIGLALQDKGTFGAALENLRKVQAITESAL